MITNWKDIFQKGEGDQKQGEYIIELHMLDMYLLEEMNEKDAHIRCIKN